MSKEKFTPGPWRTRNGDENCPVIVKAGDTKRVIANVAPKKGDHNEHSGYEVGHCRLISASGPAGGPPAYTPPLQQAAPSQRQAAGGAPAADESDMPF